MTVKIMITGGAGFIGSRLAGKLLDERKRVTILDNFDDYYTGKEENIVEYLKNKNFRLVRGSVLEPDLLDSVFHGVDTVFHLAAQPGVGYSMDNPQKTYRVNVLGTLNVLRAAKSCGVKLFVFASSSSVYGNVEGLPVKEDAPKKPVSFYGASKLAAEQLVNMFKETYGLETVMLRYFTAYGPGQRPDMAIRKFTKAVLEDKPITIYGDGNQARDFTYIDDAIDGTVAAAELEEARGETFNIGNGEAVTINDVVKIIQKSVGKSGIKLEYVEERVGDVKATLADISKARAILGYNPKVRIEEGIKKFVEWFTETQHRNVTRSD